MNILKSIFLFILSLSLIISCKKSKEEMKLEKIETEIREQTNLFLKYSPTMLPLENGKIINKFGSHIDSLTNEIIINNGIDILAQEGTNIYATAKGKILEVKTEPSNQILIDHGDGLKTRYSNLSQIQVKPNQEVTRWEIIGSAKKNGNPIHYEVIKNDTCINPLDYHINRAEIDSVIKEQTTLLLHTPSILPLQYGKIINKFGSHLDSLTNKIIINNGIDILAQADTTVRATARGKIIEIKMEPLNQVIIDHGKGLKTSYSNLSKIQVQKNQEVNRWEIIGRAKKSGNPIHYQVMKNDSCINPIDYILN
jgi:murein DD-endopeptidase MepM/ murein hydrolase activator NlpD